MLILFLLVLLLTTVLREQYPGVMLRTSRASQWIARHHARHLRHSATTLSRRQFASVSSDATLPRVGERLHGFTVERIKQVPELELTALHLRHDRTGAEHLHIARNDTNNVFSIGFKTNPPDDTGVPHILEHTTLCGSEK
jgi:presequence protease